MIDILSLMNDAFVPMALITGVALLILGINERYSNVMERIRNLNRELVCDELKNGKIEASYNRQILSLIKMARILRNALLSMYFAVFFAIISSISTIISIIGGVQLTDLMLISLVFSLLSVFLGSIFIISHIILSLRAIEIDIKRENL